VRPLRIAMVGQKGLPATWGGIEHHVEQVGERLAARGHEVTVYCRDTYGEVVPAQYRGMRLRRAPTVGTKHLDAIVHSATSSVGAVLAQADVVHYHALGPALVAPLPRYLSRAGVVLTVHGLDHERDKWAMAGRIALGAAHQLSPRVPDEVVVVSHALQEHYRTAFGREVAYVANGVTHRVPAADPSEVLDRFGLRTGRFALFVGRLVPEKRPDLLLRAFARVPTDHRLVLAGDSSFTDGFTATLREAAAADPRVVLAGFAMGEDLATLYVHCSAVVQPSSLEGLPLTLLEAVGHDAVVVASDIAPHVEVLGHGSQRHRLYPVDDEHALVAALTEVLTAPPAGAGTTSGDGVARSAQLREDVLRRYSWDDATARLEQVYLQAIGARAVRRERRRHEVTGRARAVVRTARRTARGLQGDGHPLPDFVVLGAQRCGTTSLFDDLVRHPQVRAPLAKELHYFTLHHRRPLEWYRRCFPVLREGEQTFEATPYYLFHPSVPARVARALPDARFVVLLRDPVARAVSHYLHTRRTGDEPLDLERALDAEPDRMRRAARLGVDSPAAHEIVRQHSYLSRSRYGEQVERWLEQVPRERLHVLRTEDLAADPARELSALTAFLGLEPWLPQEFTHHTRRGTVPQPDLLTDGLRDRLREQLEPDVERLTGALGWSRGWW